MTNPYVATTATEEADKLDKGIVKIFMSLITPAPADPSAQPTIAYDQDVKNPSYMQYQYQQTKFPQPSPATSSYQAPSTAR